MSGVIDDIDLRSIVRAFTFKGVRKVGGRTLKPVDVYQGPKDKMEINRDELRPITLPTNSLRDSCGIITSKLGVWVNTVPLRHLCASAKKVSRILSNPHGNLVIRRRIFTEKMHI